MKALNTRERNTTQNSHGNHAEALHPAWRAFILYCEELKYGEIERLKIQDGLPVLAEVVEKKIKFAA
jgi:hypothetical protein